MDNLNISMRKSKVLGWTAETAMPLGIELDGKPAHLEISTYKSNGGLATYAGVKLRDGIFTTTRVFRDFHQRLELSAQRCTEANVERQHRFWVDRIDTIRTDALNFHRAKGDLPDAPAPVAASQSFEDADPPETTIWGAPQGEWERMAPGIYSCSTAGHGGFWITPERLAAMPAELRSQNFNGDCQWFEEDSDWALVVRAFPAEFPALLPQAERDRQWRASRAA